LRQRRDCPIMPQCGDGTEGGHDGRSGRPQPWDHLFVDAD
jgi:hypothetical protein